MPFIILKSGNTSEENAFRKECGNAGYVPVVCTIRGRKANIHADVHALEDRHDKLRREILADDSAVSEVGRKVFNRFSPKADSWSFGYYLSITGADADLAKEMSAILAGELDAFIIRIRRSLEML